MKLSDVLAELSTAQVRDLMVENFGEENSRYHTLDEIPFYKLIAKIPKSKCSCCGKEFIPNIEGGKKIIDVWVCLDCFWSNVEGGNTAMVQDDAQRTERAGVHETGLKLPHLPTIGTEESRSKTE
jgi:hypothetical protein